MKKYWLTSLLLHVLLIGVIAIQLSIHWQGITKGQQQVIDAYMLKLPTQTIAAQSSQKSSPALQKVLPQHREVPAVKTVVAQSVRSENTTTQVAAQRIPAAAHLKPASSAVAPAPQFIQTLLQQISQQLQQQLIYPQQAQSNQQTGVVEVQFRLQPGGNIDQVKIVGSSGYELLDQAATATLQKIQPVATHGLTQAITLQISIQFSQN